MLTQSRVRLLLADAIAIQNGHNMPTPPLPDELAQAAVDAWLKHGRSRSKAAQELGLRNGTFENRLAVGRARGMHLDPAVRDAQSAVGTGMVPALIWAKTKSEDGTSYSALLKPAPEDPIDIAERMREALDGMQPAPEVPAPAAIMADLCSVYPLMDAHIGMHAWGLETGDQDYDLKLALKDMRHAFAKVLALTPNSGHAVLLIGGDFFHADDTRAETPASKHKLDVDGRFFKVLNLGIAIIAETIERLLMHHGAVTVRVLRGNHDPHSSLTLNFALSERYRDEPRLTVEKDPRDLFMMQWGRCAIFAHHGDKGKPQQMALYLSDVCPFWSATRHRHYLTGHVHHDQAKDVGPLRWESLRAFCPPDAYGAGFAPRRALQAMVFHDKKGLVMTAHEPIWREQHG